MSKRITTVDVAKLKLVGVIRNMVGMIPNLPQYSQMNEEELDSFLSSARRESIRLEFRIAFGASVDVNFRDKIDWKDFTGTWEATVNWGTTGSITPAEATAKLALYTAATNFASMVQMFIDQEIGRVGFVTQVEPAGAA